MAIIPIIILNVSCSWKMKTPIIIAVIGSKDPRIAAVVEPISLIDIVIVSIDIIVGKSASAMAHPHNIGLSRV